MKHTIIQLPDDFEKGDCSECPFSYYDCDGFDGCDCMCVFCCHPDNCPIEVKETVKVRDIVDDVFGQMRDADKQEQKLVSDFVESLSKPTGVNFYDVIDENGSRNMINSLSGGKE